MKQARITELRTLAVDEDFNDVIALKSIALEALTAVERLNKIEIPAEQCPKCNQPGARRDRITQVLNCPRCNFVDNHRTVELPQTAGPGPAPGEGPPEDISIEHSGVLNVKAQFICPKCGKADSDMQHDVSIYFTVSCRHCDYRHNGKLKVTLI